MSLGSRLLIRQQAGEQSSGEQTGNMGRVVNAGDCKTDHKIDEDDWKDARTDSALEERRYGVPVPDSKDKERSEQSENCARCAGGYRLRMVHIASIYAGDPGK